MLKFKVGDNIKVTAGKDKGREAKVERLFPKEATLLLPGLNLYKRHVKGMGQEKGGIYEIPRPYPFSKIALICPKCKKVTRVGLRVIGKEKVRICRKCNKEIDTK